MSNSHQTRPGPFKVSLERREFQEITRQRRLSNHSNGKKLMLRAYSHDYHYSNATGPKANLDNQWNV